MVKDAQNDIKAKVDETSAEFLEQVKVRITGLESLWNDLTDSNPVVKVVIEAKNEVDDVLDKAARYKVPTIDLDDNEDYDWEV